ncbi:HAD family hydrolase [Loktanella sp. SALINAS62]|uniref:sulfotransferase-like domain-containing protein n=1 Tax=Loktanella sp. SALINAS62 TaxID=2706124 RepID=UPI001B8C2EFA|nr:HAD family hydrolase [Loktanella sp. SALINAS62]MBS1302464.1 sulfotransferase [Loktanella sp. SALINAS62]
MKIAMWSGPRNLSTAMMYAFGARGDFAVWDEPFYAAYLARTGADHPMRDAIIAAHDTDPDAIAARCAGPIPTGKPHFYMKHMPHHMDGMPLDWAADCVNVHLIRHPARVIASYGAKRDSVTDDDIGFAAQAALFDRIGGLVIDSADIRDDPDGMLRTLCAAIGLPFDGDMLSWPAGGHPDDGVWAAHWYGAIHNSTGFAGPEGPMPPLMDDAADLARRALPHYDRLYAQRLQKRADS